MANLTKVVTYSSTEWEEMLQNLIDKTAISIAGIVCDRVMDDLEIAADVKMPYHTLQPIDQSALKKYIADVASKVIAASGFQLNIEHKPMWSNDIEQLEGVYNAIAASIALKPFAADVTAKDFSATVKLVLGIELDPQLLKLIDIWLKNDLTANSPAKNQLLTWYRVLTLISSDTKWPVGRWMDQLSRDYFLGSLSKILTAPLPPMVVPEEVRAILTPMFVDEFAKGFYLFAGTELSDEYRAAVERAYNSGDQVIRDHMKTMCRLASGPFDPATRVSTCKEIMDYLSVFVPKLGGSEDNEPNRDVDQYARLQEEFFTLFTNTFDIELPARWAVAVKQAAVEESARTDIGPFGAIMNRLWLMTEADRKGHKARGENNPYGQAVIVCLMEALQRADMKKQ